MCKMSNRTIESRNGYNRKYVPSSMCDIVFFRLKFFKLSMFELELMTLTLDVKLKLEHIEIPIRSLLRLRLGFQTFYYN